MVHFKKPPYLDIFGRGKELSEGDDEHAEQIEQQQRLYFLVGWVYQVSTGVFFHKDGEVYYDKKSHSVTVFSGEIMS